MSITIRHGLGLLAIVGTVAFIGCSDEIENTITCNDVCSRYEDCFGASDDNFDVDDCTDRCENEASADEDRERQLERCETCIDGGSCVQNVAECAGDCAGIVP
jgi:hypothetical protein